MNEFWIYIYEPTLYYGVLIGMVVLALIVWVALTRIVAPYGIAYRGGWGPAINNRAAWVLMEAPAFISMAAIMACRWRELTEMHPIPMGAYVCGALYLVHYFRRSFIFPLRMRGKSRMPLAIALMGAVFNIINVYLLGGCLFVLDAQLYTMSWLWSWQFLVGIIIFGVGMAINVQADGIVRNLRKPGDTRHYIPRGGMFRYVTAASYFGEIVEWAGFALLTWSWAGAVFLLWTAANLVPRAAGLHKRYLGEFGKEYCGLHRHRIFPFIY